MSSGIFGPLATVDGIAFYFLARNWWTDLCPYCADRVDVKNVCRSWFQLNPEVDGKRHVQYVESQSTNRCWISEYPSVQSFLNWHAGGEDGSNEGNQETCSFLLLKCPNGCLGSHLWDSFRGGEVYARSAWTNHSRKAQTMSIKLWP